MSGSIVCSFCGSERSETRRVVAGPGGIYICSECVQLCSAVLAMEVVSHAAGARDRPGATRIRVEIDVDEAGTPAPVPVAKDPSTASRCEFCGKEAQSAGRLIVGADAGSICNSCVDLFHEFIHQN